MGEVQGQGSRLVAQETKRPFNVIAIGEVLWDIIGTEKHLGGAPFNFAVHCHHLGAQSSIISRVGQDVLGDEILARARELGVDDSLIQRDASHPTGQVQVTLDAAGNPTFDICTGVAYDYLDVIPEALARVRAADAVCFGTLAQRHPMARASITALLEAASPQALVVCDLNLRSPHYTVEIVHGALSRCRALKLNDEERHVVQGLLQRDDLDEDAFLLHLLDTYGLEFVCVTRGVRGCTLRTRQERVTSPGYVCRVVDTVGSGDAFAAALVVKYLAGEPLAQVADFANRVGGYVATQPGATPLVTPQVLAAFARSCRLAAQTRTDTA